MQNSKNQWRVDDGTAESRCHIQDGTGGTKKQTPASLCEAFVLKISCGTISRSRKMFIIEPLLGIRIDYFNLRYDSPMIKKTSL
jgi:hypothetical protein